MIAPLHQHTWTVLSRDGRKVYSRCVGCGFYRVDPERFDIFATVTWVLCALVVAAVCYLLGAALGWAA